MCRGIEATAAIAIAGLAGAGLSARRGDPAIVPPTPGLFTATAATVLLQVQMVPWPGLERCEIGQPPCGEILCTVSGSWHLAWTWPASDSFAGPDRRLGTISGVPAYVLAVFVLPLFHGARRFAPCHALVGPVAANLVTFNPIRAPAIRCLVSVLILAVVLPPGARRFFGAHPAGPA